MSPPARPTVPPSAPGQRADRPRQREGNEGWADDRQAHPAKTERQSKNRDDRRGSSGRALPGLDTLGQPAPAPRQQAPAKKADNSPKWYYKLKPEDNAVVLYNSKAPAGMYKGTETSNGTTFEQQGMAILGDYSGNAKKNPKMIDISEPGWIQKLDELVKAQGGKKFEHVFVLDHGSPGSVSFGKHPKAYPPGPEFIGLGKDSIGTRVIASVLGDNGALHLGSCFTAENEAGRQYLNDLYKAISRGNNISIDAITGAMRNSHNQYEGELIRVSSPQPPPPSHEKR